jgi:hypothetical protein
MARLNTEQWQSVKDAWEYDPDVSTLNAMEKAKSTRY